MTNNFYEIVDLWFDFGTFCYGIESKMLKMDLQKSVFSIFSEPNQEQSGRQPEDFLAMLKESNKNLVRMEVRLFAHSLSSEPSLTLTTKTAPEITPLHNEILLSLFNLQGTTSAQHQQWTTFLLHLRAQNKF